MKGDPLGVSGDFITSPEISQVFGEVYVSHITRLNGIRLNRHRVAHRNMVSDNAAIETDCYPRCEGYPTR